MKEYVYDLIPEDRFITREELMAITGMGDRQIRDTISQIRKEHSIISTTTIKGYKKSKSTDRMTPQEMEEEYNMIKKQLHQNRSRVKELKKNMRSCVARLKILEKSMKDEL